MCCTERNLCTKEIFLTMTVVSNWNSVLRDVVESPLVVVFKTQQGAGQSHQVSFHLNNWTR